MNLDSFFSGNEWFAYQYFGAHFVEDGVAFRVYAPRASKVALIGSFSMWHDLPMRNEGRGGIYSLTVKNAKVGDLYKFRIYHQDGSFVDKADPYGFSMELRPCSASIITDLSTDCFSDADWMEHRSKGYHQPVNIYEIHFGSWKANGDRWYTYEELSKQLIPYLKENGYTHVEIMPIHEHPHDASWGYQSTGFFAATSRYGTPQGLKQFVNACHMAGIGVILDFVLVHFAVDDYGLGCFDGYPLYENNHENGGYSQWGSYQFAYARGEVASFLKSCANFWLSEYHFDGLRVDAVSNIVYYNGDCNQGIYHQGVRFIRDWNEGLHNIHPSAMLIAEDSTCFPNVTTPVCYGGLGFDYKWDLGFMHDTLQFFSYPVPERKRHYKDILFSFHYFYNELYMLEFSHDENVHGKKTILDKMYGDYEDKFSQCRAMLLYMICHPGKKLQFMGNEIGQFREWDHNRPQDFEALRPFPMHQMFARFSRDINRMYFNHIALHDEEYNKACFWLLSEDMGSDLVYAFCRKVRDEQLLFVFHFGDTSYPSYRLYMEGNHRLVEMMNSQWEIYGGVEPCAPRQHWVQNGFVDLYIPRFAGCVFRVE
ncbi:MAG: 1,4-alpha-glucan branching protein GlgB [Eubacteriales bacterium]|nr:1,4-alpha-glucan branching protein GlgB [Eubacteriales bacterium]